MLCGACEVWGMWKISGHAKTRLQRSGVRPLSMCALLKELVCLLEKMSHVWGGRLSPLKQSVLDEANVCLQTLEGHIYIYMLKEPTSAKAKRA